MSFIELIIILLITLGIVDKKSYKVYMQHLRIFKMVQKEKL